MLEKKEVPNVSFDLQKNPGFEFEILPLKNLVTKKGSNLDYHLIDFYVLIIVTAKSGLHGVDFKSHSIKRGAVITVRKSQIQKYFPSRVEGFNILFTEAFLIGQNHQLSHLNIQTLFNEYFYPQVTQLSETQLEEIVPVIQLAEEQFKKPLDEFSTPILKHLLHIVLRLIQRSRTPHLKEEFSNNYVRHFIDFQRLIELHSIQNRSVEFYASNINVSPKTLSNITHRITNKSPKKLISESLILHIKRLLINSPQPIKQIAYETGFNDPSNLYKFFKSHTGLTPELFRAEHS